jgi:hypothetical protein
MLTAGILIFAWLWHDQPAVQSKSESQPRSHEPLGHSPPPRPVAYEAP